MNGSRRRTLAAPKWDLRSRYEKTGCGAAGFSFQTVVGEQK
jgi:hypothetical protein